MPASRARQLWRSFRPLTAPLLLCGLLFFTLREPVLWWLQGQARYDEESLKEWIEEARVVQSLPELATAYLDLSAAYQRLLPERESDLKRETERRLSIKRE